MWLEYVIDNGISTRSGRPNESVAPEHAWIKSGWHVVIWTDDLRIVQFTEGHHMNRILIYMKEK